MTGIDKDEIKNKVKADEIFRWYFIKDPKKQNIYESLAGRYISELPSVESFEKLSNSALYVVNGGIMTKSELNEAGSSSEAKSIDFCWECNGYTYYASHKYTKDEGGAQGSQYNDLKSFIRQANKSQKLTNVFVAIADGPFYDGMSQGRRRMDVLKTEANSSKNVYATRICDLGNLMTSIGRAS
ncbi:hypothetical protein CENSYa_1775 [Cenarchaeum symbiosum A]|uniref:Uncharacterized protein n=1 Tax=Cenarchaeum symbiosum (strain A) TaxID=414004 RepID=A0RYG8_CENSY|nr:hypothetical protein CENSYa_1775 [Cenarchaeum symbiosum A]